MPSPKMPIHTLADTVAFVRAEADRAEVRSQTTCWDWHDEFMRYRCLRDAADALEAAIAATPAEPLASDGWHPIETAPKDEPIEFYTPPQGPFHTLGFWDKGDPDNMVEPHWNEMVNINGKTLTGPTHWRPARSNCHETN